MKNYFNMRRATIGLLDRPGLRLFVAALALSFTASGIVPFPGSHAQRLFIPVRVSNVSVQSSGGGTVVSIAADGSLSRPQTWQDNEGYHVVLPTTVAADSLKTARGLKVRRIGTSLEILLQTKPGARVSIQSGDNRLSITIDGKLEARPLDWDPRAEANSAEDQRLFEDPQYARQGRREGPPPKFSSTGEDLGYSSPGSSTETAHSSNNWNPQMGPVASAPSQTVQPPAGRVATDPADSQITVQAEDDGFLASIFSGTSVLIIFALGLFGLLVSRKLRSRQALAQASETALPSENEWDNEEPFETSNGQTRSPEDTSRSLVRAGETSPARGSSRQSVARLPVAGPTSLFGAYRIDQEVGKLILGQAHRLDVLSSRAIDDRRAIETSLIKTVNSPELDEDARRKAREALEEYGFVARQCAALLLAPDAFERTSAARSLGEIKSAAALPFLLEALYDSESIVRNQSVVSIGELKLPSAIGALLDIARMHPDVPSALLSRTLSACSVEGLDFFDAVMPEPAMLGTGHDPTIEEISHLRPASSVEDLPEGSDDELLAHAMSQLESIDVEERSEALKILVQFRVQSAVGAMALVARHDSEPSIRSQAISSLGAIDHESVFPSILIGMNDESREVKVAAARSLNRLSFDRADAYVRVIETGDDETLFDVAKACIQAGIVSQNLDRLANSDHRQAYETFALISLLAKAKISEPVLDAIAQHPDMDVRLKAVHLLACTSQPETFEQLRELAVKDGISEEVRTALLEAMYKLDQARLREEEALKIASEDEAPPIETLEATPFETLEAETVLAHLEHESEPEFELEGEAEANPNPDEREL
jgi:HEAT repeat protein